MKTKKLILLLFILLIGCSSDLLFSQTTQEEYNYLTKGYKDQIEKGQDMKKGYKISDLGTWNTESGKEKRECEFKGLYRTGQTKPCAILMIFRRTDIPQGANFYICIPSINATPEIWDQTLDFINKNFQGNDMAMKTIIWALMKFSAQEAGK